MQTERQRARLSSWDAFSSHHYWHEEGKLSLSSAAPGLARELASRVFGDTQQVQPQVLPPIREEVFSATFVSL